MRVESKLQKDLTEVLLRFRQHNYIITADISRMFCQIKVVEKDKALQRVIWREKEEEPIHEYELTMVTYGTASALYLTQRCLKQLAITQPFIQKNLP